MFCPTALCDDWRRRRVRGPLRAHTFHPRRITPDVSRRTHTQPGLAQLRRYVVAADGSHAGRTAERPGPGDSLRRADEEEVGPQLGADGALRVRDDAFDLDAVELQHELRQLREDPRPGHHRYPVAGQLRGL